MRMPLSFTSVFFTFIQTGLDWLLAALAGRKTRDKSVHMWCGGRFNQICPLYNKQRAHKLWTVVMYCTYGHAVKSGLISCE